MADSKKTIEDAAVISANAWNDAFSAAFELFAARAKEVLQRQQVAFKQEAPKLMGVAIEFETDHNSAAMIALSGRFAPFATAFKKMLEKREFITHAVISCDQREVCVITSHARVACGLVEPSTSVEWVRNNGNFPLTTGQCRLLRLLAGPGRRCNGGCVCHGQIPAMFSMLDEFQRNPEQPIEYAIWRDRVSLENERKSMQAAREEYAADHAALAAKMTPSLSGPREDVERLTRALAATKTLLRDADRLLEQGNALSARETIGKALALT